MFVKELKTGFEVVWYPFTFEVATITLKEHGNMNIFPFPKEIKGFEVQESSN